MRNKDDAKFELEYLKEKKDILEGKITGPDDLKAGITISMAFIATTLVSILLFLGFSVASIFSKNRDIILLCILGYTVIYVIYAVNRKRLIRWRISCKIKKLEKILYEE